ncbi:T9SS type A sorting domain-containing protein [Flavobacteriaceae bacterium Ap0902]|nr:T9SS type A sorting domain-containing protein [Flavobacteriaceae bacterium Ap0902]
MKKFYILCLFLLGLVCLSAQQQDIAYQISPSTFNEDEAIIITINGNSIDESLWDVNNHALYLWAWSLGLNGQNAQNAPSNGSWTNFSEQNKLTYHNDTDVYTFSMNPSTFYNRTGIGQIGFLIKAKNGDGDKKSQDILVDVGRFQVNLVSPQENSNTLLNIGESLNIEANASQPAIYELRYNNDLIHNITTPSTVYNYSFSPTQSGTAILIVRNPENNEQVSYEFSITIDSGDFNAAIPDWMIPGINYLDNDPTRAGLAIIAPGKESMHVIGSFNNWQISDTYRMYRDTNNPDLFWIELNNLTPQQIYTFQYYTHDNIKVADPYSPIVLSPYDDPYIESSDYPNLPAYPDGQDFEVSVLQTGQEDYNWQVTNFQRPEKENLIIYEVLIRDFTTEKNFQSLIDKIPYIKNLNVNAIQLMPIMEFDGNNSWGYNPSFHYALDKAYGTQEKFKEFVDSAHANGIAVILDIALNHATGRNPYVRLWNEDTSGDGYGPVRADNPYFNTTPRHSYNVFEDFNHQSTYTQYYVKRVIQHWIQEYNIDGFRWDLTKGFTQNCSANDGNCTNAYQQDRVDVLKTYADYQWEVDATSYVIFEQLGTSAEEREWANYRNNEGKGILPWNNLNVVFNQNTMGYADNSNFNYIHHEIKTFDKPFALSYGESHDEERLMFKNLAYGNSNGTYDIKDLSTALERQKAYGAILLTVPGPKMIWQFGELGYEFSINTCEDGSISNDCRLSPKPIAFEMNYENDTDRMNLYNVWADIIQLRLNNEVFHTDTYSITSGNLLPIIHIWNNDLPQDELNHVVVIANFDVVSKAITPNFPNTGNWYNLMDDTVVNVNSSNQSITLQPGEFRILGNNQDANLATNDLELNHNEMFKVVQNPAKNGLVQIAYDIDTDGILEIYNLQGRKLETYAIKANANSRTLYTRLKSGLYVLNLKTHQSVLNQKIIIQ